VGFIAALPALVGLIRTAQGLFGKGKRAEKQALVEQLAPAVGIASPELAAWIPQVIEIMKLFGASKDPAIPVVPAKPALATGQVYPVVFQPVSIGPNGELVGNLRLDGNQ